MYDGGTSDKSGSTCAPHGENGLDRAAPKALATSPAATALRQLYKNYGADGSTSDKSGSTCAPHGENGLDRAAPKALATSPAATALRQLYKNSKRGRTDGLYADGGGAFDSRSETEAKADAPRGENGLDRAASKVFATSVAETMARLQRYQNHAMLAAPNATKGCVDEEEGRASWWLFQFLAILHVELVLGLFVFGRVIPRCSSSKGTAWRSSVVGYLLIWGDVRIARGGGNFGRAAAATTPLRRVPRSRPMSLRARQSKALSSGACSRATAATTRHYEEFQDQEGSLELVSPNLAQRRRDMSYLGLVMDALELPSRQWRPSRAAEASYGVGDLRVTDMVHGSDSQLAAASFNEDIGAWDVSASQGWTTCSTTPRPLTRTSAGGTPLASQGCGTCSPMLIRPSTRTSAVDGHV